MHILTLQQSHISALYGKSESTAAWSLQHSRRGVIHALREKLERNPPHCGRWLIGMGYDNAVFPGGKHPTRFDLDRVSTELPVAAVHVRDICVVVNTKAMEQLGYREKNRIVPPGGGVDENGLLQEEAFLLPEKQAVMQGPHGRRTHTVFGRSFPLVCLIRNYNGTGCTYRHRRIRIVAGSWKTGGFLKMMFVMYFGEDAAQQFLPHQPPQDRYQTIAGRVAINCFWMGPLRAKLPGFRHLTGSAGGERKDYRGFPALFG